MVKLLVVFGNIRKSKNSDFEEWLSTNGYYYLKTEDKKTPCFKSKLTQKLNEKFRTEKRKSNPPKRTSFPFKFG